MRLHSRDLSRWQLTIKIRVKLFDQISVQERVVLFIHGLSSRAAVAWIDSFPRDCSRASANSIRRAR